MSQMSATFGYPRRASFRPAALRRRNQVPIAKVVTVAEKSKCGGPQSSPACFARKVSTLSTFLKSSEEPWLLQGGFDFSEGTSAKVDFRCRDRKIESSDFFEHFEKTKIMLGADGKLSIDLFRPEF
jgi:hypothetical protein